MSKKSFAGHSRLTAFPKYAACAMPQNRPTSTTPVSILIFCNSCSSHLISIRIVNWMRNWLRGGPSSCSHQTGRQWQSCHCLLRPVRPCRPWPYEGSLPEIPDDARSEAIWHMRKVQLQWERRLCTVVWRINMFRSVCIAVTHSRPEYIRVLAVICNHNPAMSNN